MRTRHRSASSRWLGAQTAGSDNRSVVFWPKQNSFKNSSETVLFKFCFSFLFPLCGQFKAD